MPMPFENMDLGIFSDMFAYIDNLMSSANSMSTLDTMGVIAVGFAVIVIGVSIYGAMKQWAYDKVTGS